MIRHAVFRWVALASLAAVLTACDDLLGGGGDPPPLETPPWYSLQTVAQGLVSPVALAQPPLDLSQAAPPGGSRLFVVDQVGRIRIIDATGQLLVEPFLDMAPRMVTLNSNGDERGLLGLAFHPNYESNRRFYVYYSAPLRAGAPAGWNHTNRVSEFTASATDPNRADPGSERIVLEVDHPQANHNGGALHFGRDGFLYLSIGDGGGANDTGTGHVAGGNAQSLSTLLGKILRIDPNRTTGYAIPSDNPFVGRSDALPEIWAYGFRNPYRFSFDRSTGELYVGDVGQGRWEEVDRVVREGNYGWNRREGAHCFDASSPSQQPSSCASTGARGEPLLGPVLEYANAAQPGGLGIAVVGGFLYRGVSLPDLQNHYVFGDFSAGGIRDGSVFMATRRNPDGPWPFDRLPLPDRPGGALGHFLKGIGEDARGELYFLTTDEAGPRGTTGRVYRLIRVFG